MFPPLTPAQLVELVGFIESNTISGKTAKELLPELLTNGAHGPGEATRPHQGERPSPTHRLGAELLAAYPKEVEQFHNSKTDPKLANQLLAKALQG